jgi:hypothetical protein
MIIKVNAICLPTVIIPDKNNTPLIIHTYGSAIFIPMKNPTPIVSDYRVQKVDTKL